MARFSLSWMAPVLVAGLLLPGAPARAQSPYTTGGTGNEYVLPGGVSTYTPSPVYPPGTSGTATQAHQATQATQARPATQATQATPYRAPGTTVTVPSVTTTPLPGTITATPRPSVSYGPGVETGPGVSTGPGVVTGTTTPQPITRGVTGTPSIGPGVLEAAPITRGVTGTVNTGPGVVTRTPAPAPIIQETPTKAPSVISVSPRLAIGTQPAAPATVTETPKAPATTVRAPAVATETSKGPLLTTRGIGTNIPVLSIAKPPAEQATQVKQGDTTGGSTTKKTTDETKKTDKTETPHKTAKMEKPAEAPAATESSQPAAATYSDANREAEAAAARARKEAHQREIHETAIRARTESESRVRSVIGREDLPSSLSTEIRRTDPVPGVMALIARLAKMPAPAVVVEAKPTVDPCPPLLAGQCKDKADDLSDDLEGQLKKQKKKVKKAIDDAEDDLHKDKKGIDHELDCRKNPDCADRKAREHKLEKDAKDLQDEADDLSKRGDKLEKDQKDIDQQDKNFREMEDEIKKGPPADPNCRSSECQHVRKLRADLSKERTKLVKDQAQFAKDAAKFNTKVQNYKREKAKLEKLKDQGYGMTKDEFNAHKARKYEQALKDEGKKVSEQIQKLKSKAKMKEATTGLSDLEKKQFREEYNRLENLQRKLFEKANEADVTATGLEAKAMGLGKEFEAAKDRAAQKLLGFDPNQRTDLTESDKLKRKEAMRKAGFWDADWEANKSAEAINDPAFRDLMEQRQALGKMSTGDLQAMSNAYGDALKQLHDLSKNVGKAGVPTAQGQQLAQYNKASKQLQDAQKQLKALGAESLKWAEQSGYNKLKEEYKKASSAAYRAQSRLSELGDNKPPPTSGDLGLDEIRRSNSMSYTGPKQFRDEVMKNRAQLESATTSAQKIQRQMDAMMKNADFYKQQVSAMNQAQKAYSQMQVLRPGAQADLVKQHVGLVNAELQANLPIGANGHIDRAKVQQAVKGMAQQQMKFVDVTGKIEAVDKNLNALRDRGAKTGNAAYLKPLIKQYETEKQTLAAERAKVLQNFKAMGIDGKLEGNRFQPKPISFQAAKYWDTARASVKGFVDQMEKNRQKVASLTKKPPAPGPTYKAPEKSGTPRLQGEIDKKKQELAGLQSRLNAPLGPKPQFAAAKEAPLTEVQLAERRVKDVTARLAYLRGEYKKAPRYSYTDEVVYKQIVRNEKELKNAKERLKTQRQLEAKNKGESEKKPVQLARLTPPQNAAAAQAAGKESKAKVAERLRQRQGVLTKAIADFDAKIAKAPKGSDVAKDLEKQKKTYLDEFKANQAELTGTPASEGTPRVIPPPRRVVDTAAAARAEKRIGEIDQLITTIDGNLEKAKKGSALEARLKKARANYVKQYQKQLKALDKAKAGTPVAATGESGKPVLAERIKRRMSEIEAMAEYINDQLAKAKDGSTQAKGLRKALKVYEQEYVDAEKALKKATAKPARVASLTPSAAALGGAKGATPPPVKHAAKEKRAATPTAKGPAHVGKPAEGAIKLAKADPRTEYERSLQAELTQRFGESSLTRTQLPKLVTSLADMFGAANVSALTLGTLEGLKPGAGALDFVDAFFNRLEKNAGASNGADGTYAAQLLRAQTLAGLYKAAAKETASPDVKKRLEDLKARLAVVAKDVALEAGKRAQEARYKNDPAAELKHLSTIIDAYALPGAPKRDLQPVLRDLEAAQKKLLVQRNLALPAVAGENAAATTTVLQNELRSLDKAAPAALKKALFERLADSYRILRKAVGQIGETAKGEHAERLKGIGLTATLNESRARLGAGQIDESVVLLRGLGRVETPAHAAALAATLAEAESKWSFLTPGQRARIGDLERVRREKIAALNQWLEVSESLHQIGAAGLALAKAYESAGDHAAAIAALEKAIAKSPRDPILAGDLLRRRIAAAGDGVTGEAIGKWIDAIPRDLRGAAIAVAYNGLGTDRSLKSLDALSDVVAKVEGLDGETRARLGLQLDISRIDAIDSMPLGAERDRRLGETVTHAKAALAGIKGLEPKIRKTIAKALDDVDKRHKKIVAWQQALAGNGVGGFREIGREALSIGRYDIAGDALSRYIKELDVTGDRAEAARRFQEVATILRLNRRLLAGKGLSPEQRASIQKFVDGVSGDLEKSLTKELTNQKGGYERLAKLAAEQRERVKEGDAPKSSVPRLNRSLAESLRGIRLTSRIRVGVQVDALPEGKQRDDFLTERLRAATKDVDLLAGRIPDLFHYEKEKVETGKERVRLEGFLGQLNALRSERDGIRDYMVDHTGPSIGRLFFKSVHRREDINEMEATGSARYWERRRIEIDLNGFSTVDDGIANQNEARRHGARPRRVYAEGQVPRIYAGRDSDPDAWLKVILLRDEEQYLERRATELVREDPDLSPSKQDAVLEARYTREAKKWKSWGTYSPLTFPELSGMGADYRGMSRGRYLFIKQARLGNLERDLETARKNNDPQAGFLALVNLREAYLAGETDRYVNYLNTEWYKRGPVYLKRITTNRKETQAELEAVTVDAQRLHAVLVRAAYNSVERLSEADRAYLTERGFIVNGQYHLPDDFKVEATKAGSAFSEKSVVDKYLNAGMAAELVATVVVPGALSARLAEGAFGRLALKELTEAGLSRQGAAWVARWFAEKGLETAFFTGFSRAARTALHPTEMLNGELWTLSALGTEYLHNLVVIGALKVSGGSVNLLRQSLAKGIGEAVERGTGQFLFEGAADIAGIGVEAGTLTALDAIASKNKVTQEHFLGNALTVFMLRGQQVVKNRLSPEGPVEHGTTARAQEAYNNWLDKRLALTGGADGRLPPDVARDMQNDPAAVMLRTRFGGSWDAARNAFKNGKLAEADMQMLFDFRKKVVDSLANEIKANPRIGGDWDAFGSEKLTSDYDLSFSGPMAEVAVILFNARWKARWGDAVGIGGRESAYTADTNVYTEPVYNMFPGLRADVLAQDAFAYLATRKYANDAEWADFRKQVLNGNVRPEVRDRLKGLLDWAERANAEFEKAIADRKEALSLEIYTGPGRPGMDLDAAAQNRLYEAALRDLIKLKGDYEAETSPAKRRQIAQHLRNAQARALYFASEAYQTDAAITHVVVNTQAAERPITAAMLLGETPAEPLKVPMTEAQGRQSFFEQLANTLKEFNHAHDFETAPPESFNGLAGKVAKYFVRALDGARIGGVDLSRYKDLVEATIAIEANRGSPKELADVIAARYSGDGAREFMRAVKRALGEITQDLTARQRLPEVEIAKAAERIRALRGDQGGGKTGEMAAAQPAEAPDPLVMPEGGARLPPPSVHRVNIDVPVPTAEPRAGQTWVGPDGRAYALEALPGGDSGNYARVFRVKGGPFDGRVIKIYDKKAFEELGELWDPALGQLADFNPSMRDVVSDIVYGSEVLANRGILHLKTIDAVLADGRPYVIQEALRPEDVMVGSHGDLTPGQQRAVVELFDQMARNGIIWEDGHLGNIFFRPVPGAKDVWRAGVLDTDRIAEWGQIPSKRLEVLFDRLRAVPYGDGKHIFSLTGTPYWDPKSAREFMAKMFEYRDRYVSFDGNAFVALRIDPALIRSAFDLGAPQGRGAPKAPGSEVRVAEAGPPASPPPPSRRVGEGSPPSSPNPTPKVTMEVPGTPRVDVPHTVEPGASPSSPNMTPKVAMEVPGTPMVDVPHGVEPGALPSSPNPTPKAAMEVPGTPMVDVPHSLEPGALPSSPKMTPKVAMEVPGTPIVDLGAPIHALDLPPSDSRTPFSPRRIAGDPDHPGKLLPNGELPVRESPGLESGWRPTGADGTTWQSSDGATVTRSKGLLGRGGFADVRELQGPGELSTGYVQKDYSEWTGNYGRAGDLTAAEQRLQVADQVYGDSLLQAAGILRAEIVYAEVNAGGGTIIQRQLGHHLPPGVKGETVLYDRMHKADPKTGKIIPLSQAEIQAIADLKHQLDAHGIGWQDPGPKNIFLREMNDGTFRAGIHDQDRFANMNQPLDAKGRDYVFANIKEGMEIQPTKYRINSMSGMNTVPLDTAAKFNSKAFEAYHYWNYDRTKGFTAGNLDLNSIRTLFPELLDAVPKDWPKWDIAPGQQGLLLPGPNVVPFKGRDGLPVRPPGPAGPFRTTTESSQLAMAA